MEGSSGAKRARGSMSAGLTSKEFKGTQNNPLEIDVTLRHILMQLPVPDLLNCSLVNRQWSRESRSVLRDYKTVVAVAKGYSDLIKLNDQLGQSADIPFNGIHLIMNSDPELSVAYDNSEEEEEEDPTARFQSQLSSAEEEFKFILDSQLWTPKYVKIDWDPESHNNDHWAGRTIGHLLRNHSNAVQSIKFLRMPTSTDDDELSSEDDYLSDRIASSEFPKLKSIQCGDNLSSKFFSSQFFHTLVQNAPNLNEIDVTLYSSLIETFPDKLSLVRSYFVRSLTYDRPGNLKFALSRPKLRSLDVILGKREDFTVQNEEWSALEKLLRSSQHSLKSLKIDSTAISGLWAMNLEPFSQLKVLHLFAHPQDFDSEEFKAALKALPFSVLFPKVARVDVTCKHPTRSSVIVDRVPPSVSEPPPHHDIRELCVSDCQSDDCFSFLSQVFPNVDNLSVDTENPQIFSNSLWSTWPDIKEIGVKIEIEDGLRPQELNLDAEFCGIYPEEADELRKMDEVDLKKVKIVPIRPSLTGLQKLRYLSIIVTVESAVNESIENPPFFISKVTPLIVFRRMPELCVGITGIGPAAQRLEHLTRFCFNKKSESRVALAFI